MIKIKIKNQNEQTKVIFNQTKEFDWSKKESLCKKETKKSTNYDGFGSVVETCEPITFGKFPLNGEQQKNVQYRKRLSGYSNVSKKGFTKFVKEAKNQNDSFNIILQAAKNARVPAYPLMEILKEENIEINPEHLERYLSGFLNAKGALASRTEKVNNIKRYFGIE